jgi:hypothetical protein
MEQIIYLILLVGIALLFDFISWIEDGKSIKEYFHPKNNEESTTDLIDDLPKKFNNQNLEEKEYKFNDTQDILANTNKKNDYQSNENDKILKKYNIKYIYHMTHKDNLESILEDGLLSHNNNFVSKRIDNTEVNNRRNFYEPIYNKNVQDYVPFYFNPRNAMLYVKQNIQDDLIILAFDSKLLYTKESLFTDGNAAVNGTKFFNNINDLKKLNWECIKAKYWTSFEDGKRIMMSEVLVPNKVDIEYLRKIYCNNYITRNYVNDLLSDYMLEDDIDVEVNKEMFF